MKSKIQYISLLLILVMLVSGCTLKASKPPTGEKQGSTEKELTGMDKINAEVQQTAIAKTAVLQTAQAELFPDETEPPADSQPAEPTATPASAAADTTQPEATQPAPTKVKPKPTRYIPKPIVVPSEYVLEEGEFPFCIARRFNINPIELLNANGITETFRPDIGFQLIIPYPANPFPGERAIWQHPVDYTVKEGGTVFILACLFGDVDPYAVIEANNLKPPYELYQGQQLYVP